MIFVTDIHKQFIIIYISTSSTSTTSSSRSTSSTSSPLLHPPGHHSCNLICDDRWGYSQPSKCKMQNAKQSSTLTLSISTSASPIALPELIINYNLFLHKDDLLQHKRGSGSDFQSQSNELPLDDPILHKMLRINC